METYAQKETKGLKDDETEAWALPSILGESPKVHSPPFVPTCEDLKEEDKKGDEMSNQRFIKYFYELVL